MEALPVGEGGADHAQPSSLHKGAEIGLAESGTLNCSTFRASLNHKLVCKSIDMSTTLASGSMATSNSSVDVSLVRICLLWAAFHGARRPPVGCRRVLDEDFMKELRDSGQLAMIVRSLNENHNAWNELEEGVQAIGGQHHIQYRYHYTHKSLSVIGVLGGIVLILMLVALSTCIRNRRNILLEQQVEGHERFARQILIDHLRHVGGSSSSASGSTAARPNDRPPKYDDVVKVTDPDQEQAQCPPSYVEAVQLERREDLQREGDGEQQGGQDHQGGEAGGHAVRIEVVAQTNRQVNEEQLN